MNKHIAISFLFLILNISVFAFQQTDTNHIETAAILETPTGKIFGTITTSIPFKKGPVVLIIAGSGPTDRNGNNPRMKNNSLQQLAFTLAASGISSLRFDKRGIAESASSMGKEADLRFDDYVNDVSNWISFLKADKRFTRIIVAGHSEGSLIGMIASNGRADKFISIAGAGKPAGELIREQLDKQPDQVKDIAFPILDSIIAGHTVSDVNPMLASLFRQSVQPYLISWFKYNPQTEIAKLKIPVLILQGDNDIQVSEDDAELLSKANKDFKKEIIKNMNHVLKIVADDRAENVKSYSNPSLPISGELVELIVSFVRK